MQRYARNCRSFDSNVHTMEADPNGRWVEYIDALAYAESLAAERVAAAVARERRGIIGYLDECYKVHNDEDLRRAIAALRSNEPGPGKLEHIAMVAGWADLVSRFNALVDAVNELRERGGR